jgi:predicted GNAT family acetyltransferase
MMKAYRVADAHEAQKAYPCATESPLHFWSDGLPLSRSWFADNLGQYIEALHLEGDNGQVVGHIYWAPSERALVPYQIEDRVAVVYCEWMQRQARGQGYMRLLFETFTESLRDQDYKGILVCATNIEDYMHYRHFATRGFRDLGAGGLLFLPLSQETIRVEPLSAHVPVEGIAPVEVLIIGSKSCPVGASAVLAIRKVAKEFGDQVKVKELPAGTGVLAQYGVADRILVNGKTMFFGPVSEAEVRTAIGRELAS